MLDIIVGDECYKCCLLVCGGGSVLERWLRGGNVVFYVYRRLLRAAESRKSLRSSPRIRPDARSLSPPKHSEHSLSLPLRHLIQHLAPPSACAPKGASGRTLNPSIQVNSALGSPLRGLRRKSPRRACPSGARRGCPLRQRPRGGCRSYTTTITQRWMVDGIGCSRWWSRSYAVARRSALPPRCSAARPKSLRPSAIEASVRTGPKKIPTLSPLPRTRSVRLRLTVRAFPHTQVSVVGVASHSAPRGGAVAGFPSLLGAAPLRLRLRCCASSPAPRWCCPFVAPRGLAAFGLRRPLALLGRPSASLRPLPLRHRSSLSHPSGRPVGTRSAFGSARPDPSSSLPSSAIPPLRAVVGVVGSPPCACAPRGASAR